HPDAPLSPTRRSSDLHKIWGKRLAATTTHTPHLLTLCASLRTTHMRPRVVPARIRPRVHFKKRRNMASSLAADMSASTPVDEVRSEEHTSELQSRENL